MPGLDPGIHDELQHNWPYLKSTLWDGIMDCRVKPGNDS
jgi:hypothetical protein